MSIILIALLAVGGMPSEGMASLCEEMRGTYREAVNTEVITEGEYNHLMRRCKRWEESQGDK